MTYVCTCMIRVCEPWLHTRLNTVYACIHLDLALPPRTRPRHGAPPEGEGPARRLQGAGGESGTPTRTAPTARTTSSTWPSRARAASCEARERGRQSAEGMRVHKIQRGRGKRVVCTLFTVPWEAECIHVFMYHTRMWLLTAYRCIRMHHLGRPGERRNKLALI